MEKIIFLNPLNKVYGDFFTEDEISKYSKEEQALYERCLKYHRDLKNVVDTAYEEGQKKGEMKMRMEGKIEGKIEITYEIAKNLKSMGFSVEQIKLATGLSETEIEKL
jgi:predicted transposase/invertase (TIGR01784 family)